MKRIATLTVNPTIDKYTRVEEIKAEKKLRCERPWREAGGGGLNVARVISRLGGGARALYLAGGPTGEILEGLLDEEGLEREVMSIEGWTRENLIVSEQASGKQYRFGMPGPEVEEEEWKGCLEMLEHLEPRPQYLVASGSLAPGMPDDFYGRVARVAREIDARVIVDTSKAALKCAVEAGVFLIKPNLKEFQDLVGEELENERRQVEAARELIGRGRCEVILLSLGGDGALVVSAEESRRLKAPRVEARSKVGAGDSMVGGVVLGLARELHLVDAARFGVAAGAAAVMTEGTELCRRGDTERLFEEVAEG